MQEHTGATRDVLYTFCDKVLKQIHGINKLTSLHVLQKFTTGTVFCSQDHSYRRWFHIIANLYVFLEKQKTLYLCIGPYRNVSSYNFCLSCF